MRLGPVPDNPIEWVVARLNVAPQPLFDTQIAYTLARVVMVGTKVGVFEALADGPATAGEVARRCDTNEAGTEKLLFALAGAGYVSADGDRYELTSMSRKWLLRDSPHSVADKLLLQFLEWDWMERSEEYVRTGEPLDLHSMTDEGDWDLYQRGMRSMANAFAGEALKRMPLPKEPRDMLDIGGSHGYYSVGLCRRNEGLRSVILDPDAIVATLREAEVRWEEFRQRGVQARSTEMLTARRTVLEAESRPLAEAICDRRRRGCRTGSSPGTSDAVG